MKHTFEIELRETEGRDPMLTGIVLQEGRAASQRRELFAPGSIKWPSEGIDVLPEHRGSAEVKANPIRAGNGEIRITALATDTLRAAVQAGKKFMSLEFHALEERQAGGGAIREITNALMMAAALVSNPEYTQSAAELRSKNRRRVWL